jgi:hypothetical protein
MTLGTQQKIRMSPPVNARHLASGSARSNRNASPPRRAMMVLLPPARSPPAEHQISRLQSIYDELRESMAALPINSDNVLRILEEQTLAPSNRSAHAEGANLSPRDVASQLRRSAEQIHRIVEQGLQSALERALEPSAESPAPSRTASPRNEYTTIDEEIPPYHATLHKYLDRILFDPRFGPCLRINRSLVRSERDLSASIKDLASFNLLPTAVDPWCISHVDDSEFEDMIPSLIQIADADAERESTPQLEAEDLDHAVAVSLAEHEFYKTVPSEPPQYDGHRRRKRRVRRPHQ